MCGSYKDWLSAFGPVSGCAYLGAAAEKVKDSIFQPISGERYAIVTDGWSKCTAVHGAPLINVNMCPQDAPAIFWRVDDASSRIKDKDNVSQLHPQLQEEIEQAVPDAYFIGYVMDSTVTNVGAMTMPRDYIILVLPCASHALSNMVKQHGKAFQLDGDCLRVLLHPDREADRLAEVAFRAA
jgi:hypothetical protein